MTVPAGGAESALHPVFTRVARWPLGLNTSTRGGIGVVG
jgi:hypothetical protein